MEKQYSNPAGHWGFPIPGVTVSDGVRAGNLIFVAGQVACDEKGNVLHPYDLEKQTRITMENIKRILGDLGATMEDVVKVMCWFVTEHGGLESWEPSIRVRSEYFKAPGPASTGIPVPRLTFPGMMTEIEVIAVIDG